MDRGGNLPFLEIGMPTGSVRGVLNGEKIKPHDVFTVDQVEALAALRKKSPEAADWWKGVGFPIPGAQFTFNVECAEVVG